MQRENAAVYSSTPTRERNQEMIFPDLSDLSSIPFDPGGRSTPSVGRIHEDDEFQISGARDFLPEVEDDSDSLVLIRSRESDGGLAEMLPLYRWRQKDVAVMKYIDDTRGTEKLHANLDFLSKAIDFVEHRYIKASQSEGLFKEVEKTAEEYGMKINPKKTLLIFVSAAISYIPRTYINISSSEKNFSSPTMKLLGFVFSSWPNVNAQVANVCSKFCYRLWSCLLYTSPSPRDS